MINKHLYLVAFLILLSSQAFAQKEVKATRIEIAPKIDAVLDEEVWKTADVAGDFVQFSPFNGKAVSQKSEVRFAYDNSAFYVGAMLYDTAPDSIYAFLGKRDNTNMADYFGVYLDPFNDSQKAYGFFVSASGVQVDIKSTTYEDSSWDAVWESQVKIVENGWIVEMKIPYSALRFPDSKNQTWSMNMFRNIQRYRENTSWNHVKQDVSGLNNQFGVLSGINNIEPPLRLSFTPYVSSYAIKNSDQDNISYSIKGGMDVKYGINESFTLDMMLIPDFGQVQSDDKSLNLSPFEVYYNEKRAFFMEGTELFNRAGIFYSRRIGSTPTRYYDISDAYSDEDIVENPAETQLINATKITGKTTNGLGIGFLNAITTNTYAEIRNPETAKNSKINTQPITNYNVFVFDKALKNNSYASIINTNVSRFDDKYYANVTGADFKLSNKANTYAVSGQGAVSQIFDANSANETGFYSSLSFSKTSGKFLFTLNNLIESDKYNPNDLGYLQSNNEVSTIASFQYNIYEPYGKILNFYNNLSIRYSQLYEKLKYTEAIMGYNGSTTFKNHLSIGANATLSPFEKHDYYEPRVAGRKYLTQRWVNGGGWISSDYRKPIALDFFGGAWNADSEQSHGGWAGYSVRLRPGTKFLLVYTYNYEIDKNSIGYVNNNDAEDTIYFGRRHVTTITNTLTSDYMFTNKSSLSLKVRHYWSRVEYNKFYLLNDEGHINTNTDYSQNEDINFNLFNIDLIYTWNFAPGSELLVVWKNSINADDEIIVNNFRKNFENTINSTQQNSLSLKILYYIDYMYFKKK